MIKSLLLLASHNNPSASAVAADTAVANVSAAVALPCVPAVLMVSAVAGEHAATVLTAVYIPGVPALAKVSAATVPTAVDVLPSTGVSSVPCVLPCCCFRSRCFWFLYCG
jgi:hypothetical protein